MFTIPKRSTPRWIIFSIDMGICIFSLALAYLIRFDFIAFPIEEEWPVLKWSLPVFILIRAATFYFGKTYVGIIRYTSTEDSRRIFIWVSIGSLMMAALMPLRFAWDGYYFLPLSILVMDYLLTTFLMITFRIAVKLMYTEQVNPTGNRSQVVIYGAGELGLITKRTLDRDAGTRYKVIAFIDDDEKKSGKSLEGVMIYPSAKLEQILTTNKIDQLIVGILHPDAGKKKNIIETCIRHQVDVLNVPPVQNWINGELSLKQIRKVRIEDLLGRAQIKLDEKNISSALNGKRILITGAAGSIGSEIVRQVCTYHPAKVVLLDQAESALYDLEMELWRSGLFQHCEVVVADITMPERMERVFSHFQPQVIFHSAAYKHVPLMEDNPSEALRTNIQGTKILVDLSLRFNAERFVMISTDKAVNPTNVMGATKRVAEIYAQSASSEGKTKFITTRFGNVLGSNGSVIPLFRKQIEQGGPVTVTDPNVTRFFMTIPEACQLVLEAGTMGKGGEIFVFDMGESVKIIDLAEKMIRLSGFEPGRDIQIKITGLRPGEKLYEEVLSDKENTIATHHPQIMIAKVREYNREEVAVRINGLTSLFNTQDNMLIVSKLKEIVPEYISQNSVFSKLD